jgi:hypothetical protein
VKPPSPATGNLIRSGDSAPVFFGGGEPAEMSWGFRTAFDSTIHQARADSLNTGMWAKAFRNRRKSVAEAGRF